MTIAQLQKIGFYKTGNTIYHNHHYPLSFKIDKKLSQLSYKELISKVYETGKERGEERGEKIAQTKIRQSLGLLTNSDGFLLAEDIG